MKILYGILVLFISCSVWAACPLGDSALKAKKYEQARSFLEGCALMDNDALAHYKLAHLYADGLLSAEQPQLMTLRYLRFSAENGYAPAQYELGRLMLEALRTAEGKALLTYYTEQIRQLKEEKNLPLSQMSPMTWILLAAERAENKWFYTAPAIYVPEAEKYLQDAHLTQQHLQEIRAQAIQWKQNKLMHTARQVMSDKEMQQFFPMPENPTEAATLQNAFVALLKNKLKNYTLYN